jgi:hypothetical protein
MTLHRSRLFSEGKTSIDLSFTLYYQNKAKMGKNCIDEFDWTINYENKDTTEFNFEDPKKCLTVEMKLE